MYLEMYLSTIPVERKDLSFEGCYTLDSREAYLNSITRDWYKKHVFKIIACGEEPVFYISGVESKLAHVYDASWQEIINQVGSNAAKKKLWPLIEKLELKETHA